MAPDDFQRAWQAESSHAHLSVDADLLQNEVRRNQRNFRARILRRDFTEVGIGLFMLPVWFYLGSTLDLPWTWYLTVPAILWGVAFFVVYRRRHPQNPSVPNEPLRISVENSLTEIDHQIWLLRNVFWWYLLPYSVSILAFFAHVAWLSQSGGWLEALLFFLGLATFLVAIYYFAYWLNQRTVNKEFEPRRIELMGLLAGLGDESLAEFATADRARVATTWKPPSRWPVFVAGTCVVAFILIGMASGLLYSARQSDPNGDDAITAPNDSAAYRAGPGGESLAELITGLRQKKNLVGLAAMVMVNGQVQAAAVDGERKQSSGVRLQIDDRWHLGGISKAITATMLGRLIESGQLDWSHTVGEAFPEASVHEDWKRVTLRQLLTDSAGAPANFPREVSRQRPASERAATTARRKAVVDVLGRKPAVPPGSKYVYSCVSHTIAAAMAEELTGATWEDLMRQQVFKPLKLTGSGFGPPASSDATLEQPRGHRTFSGTRVALSDKADNTAIIGPAGTVHMTLSDLCMFATEHLQGYFREGRLLSAETHRVLHTPEISNYACGWIRKKPNAEIEHTVYWHNGSNTLWYALVTFIPERDMVVAVTSNDGDVKSAEAAAWEIVAAAAGYPKKSPFSAIRWRDSQPEVRLDNEWFLLVSLNDLAASEIIAFSRRRHHDKWQKRFEEDLVQLLSEMGHPPQDTVTLQLQTLASSETEIRDNVPMTEENRRKLRNRANSRADKAGGTPPPRRVPRPGERREVERQAEPRAAVPIDDRHFGDRVDRFLQQAHNRLGFSGVVAVARGGDLVYQGARGLSHLDHRVPNALDTPFRVAAISQSFTAAAIFALEANGKLTIDDRVSQYLPDFDTAPYREITLYHLLTHTSGLPGIPRTTSGLAQWNKMSRTPTAVGDYVRLASQVPLDFPPGHRTQYSSFGYRILSAVIEQASGLEYADFMEKQVFERCGLTNSGVARISQPRSEGKVAEELNIEELRVVELDPNGPRWTFTRNDTGCNYGTGYGDSGVFTSANDLLRWDRVLTEDDFLPAVQKSTMFRPVSGTTACGWVVEASQHDGRICQSNLGISEACFGRIVRIPEDELTIVALCNVPITPDLRHAVEQLFLLCRSRPYQEP